MSPCIAVTCIIFFGFVKFDIKNRINTICSFVFNMGNFVLCMCTKWVSGTKKNQIKALKRNYF